jgi:MscS family membrane protein
MDVTLGLAWFKSTLVGNEIWRFLAWLGVVLAAFLVGRILRHNLVRIAGAMERRRKPVVAVFLSAGARAMVFALIAIALDAGLHFLEMSVKVEAFMTTVMNVLIVAATTYVVYCIVDALCEAWALAASKTASKMDDMLVPMVRRSLQITVVLLGLVQVATVLSDKPLTSILAGLGVGGLAVALAAQDTIKNFFGSITVLTDKPFELGDRVVVDKYDGTVVEVGFRSTRLRTLDGDLVSIPNGDLANRIILNSGRRPFFRRVLNLALPNGTDSSKVKRALEIVKGVVDNHPCMDPNQPPRVYFTDCTGVSITLQALYWYNSGNVWDYMAFNEKVNLEILERLYEEGILVVVQPLQAVNLDVRGEVPAPVKEGSKPWIS